MVKVNFYDLNHVGNEDFKFAVIVSRYNDKWVLCKHKERFTYEIPGGHRGKDEWIADAAKRELWEETGATDFRLFPVCAYAVETGGEETFGMLYFAEITALGKLPDLEIEKIEFFEKFPAHDLTYPRIQPELFEKVQEYLKKEPFFKEFLSMRSENKVLNQLLGFAKEENQVRAVLWNGSRVNPNVKKDIFCDYDVVFSVIEPGYFLRNQDWIRQFGDLIIMQQNDCMVGGTNAYIFLMQFTDGVRIDLSFHSIEVIAESVRRDSLTEVLLDKDNRIPLLDAPNESVYYVKKPSIQEFTKVVNEAWWIQTYVAKGIWRGELPLVKWMFDGILMDCLIKLLSWQVGLERNWQVNVGKCGRWLKKYLPPDIYEEFVTIYPGTDDEEIWQALAAYGKFVRKIGVKVAEGLGYIYPMQDDINVSGYLQEIYHQLPKRCNKKGKDVE